jgi:hypothetical protein
VVPSSPLSSSLISSSSLTFWPRLCFDGFGGGEGLEVEAEERVERVFSTNLAKEASLALCRLFWQIQGYKLIW